MKKLLGILVLGLLTCNISFADNLTLKDMTITCDSNDYFLQALFERIEKKETHTYKINIVNNAASLVSSTNTTWGYYYNYPLYKMSDKAYVFYMPKTLVSNAYTHDGKIQFDRINATAIITYSDYSLSTPNEVMTFELIEVKNCKASDIDDKPKF